MVAIRWDSVRLYQDITQTYSNGAPAYRHCTYVALAPGASATITEFFENPETWGSRMQEAVVHAQGTKVQEAVLAGETVRFGAFEVSGLGIATAQKSLLSWPDAQEIQLRADWARVMRTGVSDAWDADAVSRIANLYVFLTIAENLSTQ